MRENCDVAVVGVGVIGLATAFELLTRGLAVTLIGPRDGSHAGQATWAAGAMLSTFSEIEPHHHEQRVTVETTERLAAHEMYPAWLETISGHAGQRLAATPGTWVLAPAGKRAWLEPIAAGARAASHPAELHDATDIPRLVAPAASAAALWLPTEARIDSADLMEALTRAVAGHPSERGRTGPGPVHGRNFGECDRRRPGGRCQHSGSAGRGRTADRGTADSGRAGRQRAAAGSGRRAPACCPDPERGVRLRRPSGASRGRDGVSGRYEPVDDEPGNRPARESGRTRRAHRRCHRAVGPPARRRRAPRPTGRPAPLHPGPSTAHRPHQ